MIAREAGAGRDSRGKLSSIIRFRRFSKRVPSEKRARAGGRRRYARACWGSFLSPAQRGPGPERGHSHRIRISAAGFNKRRCDDSGRRPAASASRWRWESPRDYRAGVNHWLTMSSFARKAPCAFNQSRVSLGAT